MIAKRSRSERLHELTQQCIDHLLLEDKTLSRLGSVVDGMHRGLSTRDYDEVESLAATEEFEQLQGMAASREKLRTAISEELEIPEPIATIRLLVDRINPSQRESLNAARNQVIARAEDLNRKLNGTRNLANCLYMLISGVFTTLAGESAAPEVYNRAGQNQLQAAKPIV